MRTVHIVRVAVVESGRRVVVALPSIPGTMAVVAVVVVSAVVGVVLTVVGGVVLAVVPVTLTIVVGGAVLAVVQIALVVVGGAILAVVPRALTVGGAVLPVVPISLLCLNAVRGVGAMPVVGLAEIVLLRRMLSLIRILLIRVIWILSLRSRQVLGRRRGGDYRHSD